MPINSRTGRVHAIASGDEGCVASVFLGARSAQTRDDVSIFITVAEKLGLPFNRDAKLVALLIDRRAVALRGDHGAERQGRRLLEAH